MSSGNKHNINREKFVFCAWKRQAGKLDGLAIAAHHKGHVWPHSLGLILPNGTSLFPFTILAQSLLKAFKLDLVGTLFTNVLASHLEQSITFLSFLSIYLADTLYFILFRIFHSESSDFTVHNNETQNILTFLLWFHFVVSIVWKASFHTSKMLLKVDHRKYHP